MTPREYLVILLMTAASAASAYVTIHFVMKFW